MANADSGNSVRQALLDALGGICADAQVADFSHVFEVLRRSLVGAGGAYDVELSGAFFATSTAVHSRSWIVPAPRARRPA